MEKFTNSLRVAVFLISILHSIEGHLFFGSCPELLTADNFTISDIEGTWYEIEAFGSFIERQLTKCNSPTFIIRSENNFNVEYSRVAWPTGRLVSKGYGKVKDEGQLELFFRLPGVGMQKFQYHILAIEKGDYAVAWSCTQLPMMHMQKAWILSRTKTLDEDTLDKAYDTVEFNGMNRNYFVKVKQSNCQANYDNEVSSVLTGENSLQDEDDLDIALKNY